MSNFEIIRRVTEPTTDAKVMDIVRARYGHIRENIGNDDPVLTARVTGAHRRISTKRAAESGGKETKPAFG